MELAEYEIMYRIENDYWWYRGLHDLVASQIDGIKQGRRDLVHLDAGCGTGRLLELCREHAPMGLDLSPEALRFVARRGRFPVSLASILELPFHEGTFDLVTSNDVICILGAPDDQRAVGELARVLKPGGSLIINVPAFPFLACRHDVAVHTRRRYRTSELAELMTGAGLEVTASTYRVSFLFPVVAAIRSFQRLVPPDPEPRSDLSPMNPVVNDILSALMRLENACIRRGLSFPFGISAYCWAVKPG